MSNKTNSYDYYYVRLLVICTATTSNYIAQYNRNNFMTPMLKHNRYCVQNKIIQISVVDLGLCS